MKPFPIEAIEALKSYVYIYSDPRDGKPFYVGKGIGNRVFSHLDEVSEAKKVEKIRQIRLVGLEPMIEIVRYGLTDDEATLLEASIIDLFGLKSLTNQVRGQHSRSFGRVKISDLLLMFTAQPAKVTHRALLITINRLYRTDMSAQELFEATRGIWKVGERRENAELALAVYQGIVREVYRIKSWHRAGTLNYETRKDISSRVHEPRWEFDGEIAKDVREQYIGKLIGKSGQNPVKYVNC
jgi:hypothetical protein